MINLGAHEHARENSPADRKLKHAWSRSLRFRLIWLGLMPLLLGLPIVLLSLGLVGGAQLNRLIEGQLNSNLSGAQNYLNVFRTDLQSRIADLVQSDRNYPVGSGSWTTIRDQPSIGNNGEGKWF